MINLKIVNEIEIKRRLQILQNEKKSCNETFAVYYK